MANRNIQMKKKNGDLWDNMFPITLDSNVVDENGKSVKTQLAEITSWIEPRKTDPPNPPIGKMWLTMNDPPTEPKISVVSIYEDSITIRLDEASTDEEIGEITTYRAFINGVDEGIDIQLNEGDTYQFTGLNAGETYIISLRGKDNYDSLSEEGIVIKKTPEVLAYWKMDESSGNLIDSSGKGVYATPNNVNVVSGLISGNARQGNGTDAYIEASESITQNQTSLSISMYFRRDSELEGYQMLLSEYRNAQEDGVGWYIGYHSSSSLGLMTVFKASEVNSSRYESQIHPTVGDTYKLNLIWDGNTVTVEIYKVDNDTEILIDSFIDNAKGYIANNLNPLTMLCANSVTKTEFAPFTIDEVKISEYSGDL